MSILNNIFHRDTEINPFPVSDTVRFRNVDKTLTLQVKSSASAIVVAIRKTQETLGKMTDDTPEQERKDAAVKFAEAIFGHEQAVQLMDFYNNEPLTVISACGMYFSKRLGKIITKAQKAK